MKLIYQFFLALSLVFSSCSSDEPNNGGTDDACKLELTIQEKELADAQHEMQIDMLAKIFGKDDPFYKNKLFSPVNLTVALSMLANASSQQDVTDIGKLIGCTDLDRINTYNSKLMRYLPNQGSGNKLKLANGIWYRAKYDLTKTFVDNMNNVYRFNPVSVAKFDDKAIDEINKWAEASTEGLIKIIANEMTCNNSTKMFLASAIYYKGLWQNKFSKDATKISVFHASAGDKEVPMMFREGTFNYGCVDDCRIIEMPYKGNLSSMYVILPPENVSLADYMKSFTPSKFLALRSSMSSQMVDVSLPRYKCGGIIPLGEYLKANGIDIPNITLSGAGINEKLGVGFNQIAYISVDEEGSEMAAVTGTIATSPVKPEKCIFKADRPFISIVMDKSTGAIIMASLINSPEDKE